MKPLNMDRSRLLGFKIIGKKDASLNDAKIDGAAAIGSKVGPKPSIDAGSAVMGPKIGAKPPPI